MRRICLVFRLETDGCRRQPCSNTPQMCLPECERQCHRNQQYNKVVDVCVSWRMFTTLHLSCSARLDLDGYTRHACRPSTLQADGDVSAAVVGGCETYGLRIRHAPATASFACCCCLCLPSSSPRVAWREGQTRWALSHAVHSMPAEHDTLPCDGMERDPRQPTLHKPRWIHQLAFCSTTILESLTMPSCAPADPHLEPNANWAASAVALSQPRAAGSPGRNGWRPPSPHSWMPNGATERIAMRFGA